MCLNDDYDSLSPYIGDISEMMNIRMELRVVYVEDATIFLNVIIPNAIFALLTVNK
jgi:hypothetical protein